MAGNLAAPAFAGNEQHGGDEGAGVPQTNPENKVYNIPTPGNRIVHSQYPNSLSGNAPSTVTQPPQSHDGTQRHQRSIPPTEWRCCALLAHGRFIVSEQGFLHKKIAVFAQNYPVMAQ
jgi:hypothetical protein